MSLLLYSLICPGLLLALTPHEDAIHALDTGWHIQTSTRTATGGDALSRPGADISGWYPVNMPKTVLAGLVDNRVYPDPYFGTNLKNIPGYQDGLWLIQKEDSPFSVPWWYRVEFDVPDRVENRYFSMHFEGINYEANIWLNGQKIAGRDEVIGMFRRFEFDVTEQLAYGQPNVLAVEIIPPGLLPELPYRTKQIEATTGWDDHNPHPPDMNMGIWQPVYLYEQGPVSIRHPYVESAVALPGLETARLTVSAWLRNNTDAPRTVTLSGAVEARQFSQELTLDARETREVFFSPEAYPVLVVENPRVWWPHPVGSQELYALRLEAAVDDMHSDTAGTTFGIRDIETYITDDDWRGYRVNGRNILIRGGAWMTIDMLLNLDPALYEALVRYAQEANFNMLRSEGFSIRETNLFYDLCDRYGIMVTQQIFGRNIPDEALAIACIEDMMLRTRNHPSLAHFLGHDETFPTETLDQAYQELIRKHRVGRSYQPHSGTFNIATRARTGGTRTGTRELWTYAGPSHYHFVEERREDSAWGFAQSGGIGGILSARDSIRQMMPEEALWPIENNETWSFHTVIQGIEYFDAIFKTMERKYGAPTNFDDFCDKLYAMNYNSARGMYEAYARHKYEALGITTWKYNTAWPAALTWQYVDWYKRPSAAYYGAKKACTPLHILYAHDDQGVYVTNSYYESHPDLQARYALYNMDGSLVAEEHMSAAVEADGRSRVAVIEPPDTMSDPWFLRLELLDSEGALLSDNTYWLSHTPDIPGTSGQDETRIFYVEPESVADFTALRRLPNVALDVVAKRNAGDGDAKYVVEINNPTPHIAFMVEAALIEPDTQREAAPVYWSDNYLILLPGESRRLEAHTAADTPGATQLRVQGFNIDAVMAAVGGP